MVALSITLFYTKISQRLFDGLTLNVAHAFMVPHRQYDKWMELLVLKTEPEISLWCVSLVCGL